MKNYPKHLTKLPSIISFDEFKADTKAGKYAFILSDLLHKKTLDILPSRKLVTTIMFPKAKYVVDHFHYIGYIMDALDKI